MQRACFLHPDRTECINLREETWYERDRDVCPQFSLVEALCWTGTAHNVEVVAVIRVTLEYFFRGDTRVFRKKISGHVRPRIEKLDFLTGGTPILLSPSLSLRH